MKEQKSFYAKKEDINKKWIVIDAKDEILGRLASKVAGILRGKNKAVFSPSVDIGDNVVIINAEKIKVTGKKETDKIYYTHSGFPGGLKSIAYRDLLKKRPEKILYNAIKGMIPKNKLGRKIMTNVRIYEGETHPHDAQLTVASGGKES